MTERRGGRWHLVTGNAASALPTLVTEYAGRVGAVVTSPPYFALRDYTDGDPAEIGIARYGVKSWCKLVADTLDATIPLLSKTAVVWVNVGDTYNAYNANRGGGGPLSGPRDEFRQQQDRGLTDPSIRNKSLVAAPQRLAVELVDRGWILRSDITWERAAMPERVTDRPKRSTERILMLTRRDRYGATQPEDPKWARDVWRLPTASGASGHSARFPVELPAACLSWTPDAGVVLDPFSGVGTTGLSALVRGHSYVGIDLQDDFNVSAARLLKRMDGK